MHPAMQTASMHVHLCCLAVRDAHGAECAPGELYGKSLAKQFVPPGPCLPHMHLSSTETIRETYESSNWVITAWQVLMFYTKADRWRVTVLGFSACRRSTGPPAGADFSSQDGPFPLSTPAACPAVMIAGPLHLASFPAYHSPAACLSHWCQQPVSCSNAVHAAATCLTLDCEQIEQICSFRS